MNLNEYFEIELNKRIARAEQLIETIKPYADELGILKKEISTLEGVLALRRNQK